MSRDEAIVKAVRQRFFMEFVRHHTIWLRELVEKYKARGEYPVFPTQIIDYYPDNADKQVAAFAAFCMKWGNGREIEQMASMRELMGDHPAQWLASREFAAISVGRLQMSHIDGYNNGFYWKVAKVFDLLYDECKDGREMRLPSEVFSRSRYMDYVKRVGETCEINDIDYIGAVVELVMRTKDGIGRGLWRAVDVPCPESRELHVYMHKWFPYWGTHMWTWREAVSMFRLEHDYDFFYAMLAHKEFARQQPVACRRYATRFRSRWDKQLDLPYSEWLGAHSVAPVIEFKSILDENDLLNGT